jgi:hypothetical protein
MDLVLDLDLEAAVLVPDPDLGLEAAVLVPDPDLDEILTKNFC